MLPHWLTGSLLVLHELGYWVGDVVMQGMMEIITESAHTVVNTWKREIEANNGGIVDLVIDGYMKRFSGDIISRACFGSNYAKGQDIFVMLGALQELVSKKTMAVGLPGLRYKNILSLFQQSWVVSLDTCEVYKKWFNFGWMERECIYFIICFAVKIF